MQRDSDRDPRSLFAFLGWVAVASVAAALLARALVAQVYLVPSGSMRPTLEVGDRVLVEKVSRHWRPIQRGDVIAFDGTDVWGSQANGLIVAKRVIGVEGDHVVCCDDAGRISLNGVPLRESGANGRGAAFDVMVPADRVWVLGDDRAHSRDSATFTDTPGGGAVPVSHIIGRAIAVVWPLDRAGILGALGTEEPQ